MANSPGFRQIRQCRLVYDGEVTATLPKTLSVLDVVAIPDPHGKLNVPYLVYLYEGGDTELKTLRLISGQAELDYTHESFRYLGTIPPKNNNHPNFCTLWQVTKKKSHPDLAPPPPPPEPKPKKKAKVPLSEAQEQKLLAQRDAFEKRMRGE